MPSPVSALVRFLVYSSLWASPVRADGRELNRTRSAELPNTVSSCDARTINYITHTLPQFCLTSTWTSAASTPISTQSNTTSTESKEHDAPPPAAHDDPQSQPAATHSKAQDDDPAGDAATKPFMSFEAWKEKMLRETGQDPQDLRSRNSNPRKPDDRIPPDMGHAGLGEEDEISLDFDSYLNKVGDKPDRPAGGKDDTSGEQGVGQTVVYEDGRSPSQRSKDAGKTCKERFSYSSFDAGATVLKTSPGAKNAKAILVENKDSYMLLECQAASKFIIVELSDDVLIDTVVLSNFEFFSSMIRHFRVSVSDRYPIKADRWKELGLFEARNSRDIQPFLVQNPLIWAKYVRIEFLTQYGKEYYCPVSLLRIHGSRMLDSWKDTEGGRDDDLHGDDDAEESTLALPSSEQESVKPVEEVTIPKVTPKPSITKEVAFCQVSHTTEIFYTVSTCSPTLNQTIDPTQRPHEASITTSTGVSAQAATAEDTEKEGTTTAHSPKGKTDISATQDASSTATTASPTPSPAVSPSSPSSISSSSIPPDSSATASPTSIKTASVSSSTTTISTVGKPSPANVVTPKNRTTGTSSAASAAPTVQEGFFKAISKRLHQVESNLTLSLQYVEDQARHMQESLQRTEQKQLSKATIFLETLNQTVLAELRVIREQYDQIWQSTVIALESQREQSEREIVALSTRLNLLADEVVFQKRMAILQAVLLLSCLLLVIFSRGVSIPYLGPFTDPVNMAPYDASTSTPARVRAMYAAAYGADVDPVLLTPSPQRNADFIPMTPASVGVSPLDARRRSSLDADAHDILTERDRLSPPLTPGAADEYASSEILTSRETSTALRRRSPAMQQSTNSRKPLPALPENPASP